MSNSTVQTKLASCYDLVGHSGCDTGRVMFMLHMAVIIAFFALWAIALARMKLCK